MSWSDPPRSQRESSISSLDRDQDTETQTPERELPIDPRHEEVLQIADSALDEAIAALARAKAQLAAADRRYNERMGRA